MKLFSSVEIEAYPVRGGGLGSRRGLLPALLRQGGRAQAGRHAGPQRPPHHGGHVEIRQGELGRAQQVHDQGQ